MKNHQYYITIDDLGLKFVKTSDKIDLTEYRLDTLNKLGLFFIGSINLRHQRTDNPVVIAIFEEK